MSNIKVFDKKTNKWWIPVPGDTEGRVEVDGHIYNPLTQEWEPYEGPDEDTPRRLMEKSLAETEALNEKTLELLDETKRYARSKTFNRTDHVFFSRYNPANDANYVFDHNGNTADTAGWIDTGEYDIGQFSVMVTTLGSTTILLLIQGDVAGQFTDYYIETFSATTTRPKLITVNLPPRRMRVGLMVTVDGTDSVTITCELKKM